MGGRSSHVTHDCRKRPGEVWGGAGEVLGRCWGGAGEVLVRCWEVLGRCWGGVGEVFERCWRGVYEQSYGNVHAKLWM